MALQNRLANVPGMFSEGIEVAPDGKRRTGERSIVGRLGAAMLAAALGARAAAKPPRVSIQG